jgi:ATP-dependent helicase/nuclease subunit B
METFLSEFATELISNHQSNLADICVVLPNRRSGLFLRKALSEKSSTNILSPDIYSIEDFLTEITGIKPADTATFLFELYEIHKYIEKNNAQPLEQFIKIGQKMLADFNDVDKYLADPEQLFGYLSEAKAIEKWNPDGTPLTASEQDYLAFFRKMHDYYLKINSRLSSRNEAYQGMIYRKAAGMIELLAGLLRWQKIYFAGFNALTASEEKVISYLRISGKAEIIRDADDYYLSDSRQEAGYFLRKALKNEGVDRFGKIGYHFRKIKKRLCLHGTPGFSGQVALAARILNQRISDVSAENSYFKAMHTAVVPADEKLLIPLLSALPVNLGKVNVTMGYPLKLTPAYNFVVTVFRLFENAERLQRSDKPNGFRFYYRDIVALLHQPMVSGIFETAELLDAINQSKQVFYSHKQILALKSKSNISQLTAFLHPLLVENQPEPPEALHIIETTIETLRERYLQLYKEASDRTAGLLQLEYLHLTATIFQRIRELNERFNDIHRIRALRETFVLLAAATNLPFSGEPLQGIQILGMLETRNLDFECVILVSANEGILPAGGKGDSFIPYDIRNVFNLPTHNHHNAVAAYHFYRLLQRASEVHIIYNTEAGELGGGEQSRFVQQLLTEYPQYNPGAEIVELVETPVIPEKATGRSISVQKDLRVFEDLKKKAASGFSPTSLNHYRRCTLQFYFKNIAGIKTADEVEETIEYRTIGSIVHEVLEKLYKPFKNTFINSGIIALMKSKANMELKAAFDKLYPEGQVKFGRNRLLLEVIRNFVFSYLETEKAMLADIEAGGSKLKILDLEQPIKPLETLIEIPELNDVRINFRGSIDRVDELDGTIRIIDYKTGKVAGKGELRINEWEDFTDGSKHDKPFQVLLYAWLYKRMSSTEHQQIIGGVISLRNLSKGLIKFGIKYEGTKDYDEMIDDGKLQAFEKYLKSLFLEMFDSNLPFSQTDNIKICEYCDYKNICNR